MNVIKRLESKFTYKYVTEHHVSHYGPGALPNVFVSVRKLLNVSTSECVPHRAYVSVWLVTKLHSNLELLKSFNQFNFHLPQKKRIEYLPTFFPKECQDEEASIFKNIFGFKIKFFCENRKVIINEILNLIITCKARTSRVGIPAERLHPTECPGYNSKSSDREAPVMLSINSNT